MTLVVCLKAIDGIVLAADSRGTIGDPRGLTAINDSQTKLFKFGVCGIAFAGASEMGAALLDELNKTGIDGINNVDEAVVKLVNESGALFSAWFRDIPPQQRPGVLITLAGYRFGAGVDPQPMIYLLNSQMNFAPQLFDKTCLAGVPQYAVYLVHRYYDPSMKLERAKALAEYLISETASQDPKVGGPIKIVYITPDKGYQELSQDEVSQISQSNEVQRRGMRGLFLEE